MNGVNIEDVYGNFTTDERDEAQAARAQLSVYNQRKHSYCYGSGGSVG